MFHFYLHSRDRAFWQLWFWWLSSSIKQFLQRQRNFRRLKELSENGITNRSAKALISVFDITTTLWEAELDHSICIYAHVRCANDLIFLQEKITLIIFSWIDSLEKWCLLYLYAGKTITFSGLDWFLPLV